MPTNHSVVLQAGTVPPNACFTSVAEMYQLFISITSAYVNGNYSLYNFGESKPSVNDTDKPWIRTVNGFPDKLYVYQNGYWLSPHLVPTSGSERRMWVGGLNDLKTYDGGADEDVSDYTGPFWEVDEELAAKFPVGVGEFPSGVEVAVNGTGGVDEVTLTTDQIPDHTHDVKLGGLNASLDSDAGNEYGGDGLTEQTITSEGTGGGSAHTNLPPYYGVYFIKRTARVYYSIQ